MTTPAQDALLGRAHELGVVTALLDRARSGESGALAMLGVAGTGKTRLLAEAVRLPPGAHPVAVLRARGVESEADVAFAGLLELVRPVTGLISQLPEPQARALEGALALAPTEATDRFSVSAATLGVLAAAAADGAVLVIVDDLHWLDQPSAQAILFAARRLWREGIAMLISSRPEAHAITQLEGIPLLNLDPLGDDDAAALARAFASRALADDEVEALVGATGGNPLAIVEAARNVGTYGYALEGLVVPIPVAERIRVGVERRIERLLPDERRAVLIAAAAGTRSACRLVDGALRGEGLTLDALDAAERQDLLFVRGDTVEFEHPLTRSAVYAAAGSGERRGAHRALAGAYGEGAPESAWHLAAAAVGADEQAALALERAGTNALARGAPSSALRAFDRAAALSADIETAAQRLLLAGDAARLAGNLDRAREVISLALERSRDPLVRADALEVLFEIDTWRAPVATARSIAAEADRLAALDQPRAAKMLAEAAAALARSGSIPEGVQFAERAQALAGPSAGSNDAVELSLLFTRVMDARAPEAVGPLLALGDRLMSSDPSAQSLARLQQVAWAETWLEQYDSAAMLLEHAVAVGRNQAPGTLPMALATRGELWYRTGRLQAALADTAEAASLAVDFGQLHPRGLALTCRARIEACLGREQECRSTAAEAAEVGVLLGGEGSPVAAYGAPALGLLELGLGRPHDAVPHLENLVVAFRRGGIREPGVVLAVGDLVEAYVKSDRHAEAQDLLGEFETIADLTQRVGAKAIAARCRALLAGPGRFEAPMRAALRLHASINMPFETARSQLNFGDLLLAAGRGVDARLQLRAALDGFQMLGAEHWATQAARQLEMTGETAAARPSVPSDALTPQELQVALVAASGVTDQEAAAQLFLSAKTVEAHLHRIYRKLGVRSQTELAARVGSADVSTIMDVRSLGGFEVVLRGVQLGPDKLGGAVGRQLMAALLAMRGPVLREALRTWIWPDLAAEPGSIALRDAVEALRETIGPERILAEDDTVQISLAAADRWDALLLLATADDQVLGGLTAQAVDDALATFSAPLFPEWPGADWAVELEQVCVEALSRLRGYLGGLLLEEGRYEEALMHFSALNEADPADEAWHRGLMRCHAAAGNVGSALRQYHVCRSALMQSTGEDPAPETRALYLALLAER